MRRSDTPVLCALEPVAVSEIVISLCVCVVQVHVGCVCVSLSTAQRVRKEERRKTAHSSKRHIDLSLGEFRQPH